MCGGVDNVDGCLPWENFERSQWQHNSRDAASMPSHSSQSRQEFELESPSWAASLSAQSSVHAVVGETFMKQAKLQIQGPASPVAPKHFIAEVEDYQTSEHCFNDPRCQGSRLPYTASDPVMFSPLKPFCPDTPSSRFSAFHNFRTAQHVSKSKQRSIKTPYSNVPQRSSSYSLHASELTQGSIQPSLIGSSIAFSPPLTAASDFWSSRLCDNAEGEVSTTYVEKPNALTVVAAQPIFPGSLQNSRLNKNNCCGMRKCVRKRSRTQEPAHPDIFPQPLNHPSLSPSELAFRTGNRMPFYRPFFRDFRCGGTLECEQIPTKKSAKRLAGNNSCTPRGGTRVNNVLEQQLTTTDCANNEAFPLLTNADGSIKRVKKTQLLAQEPQSQEIVHLNDFRSKAEVVLYVEEKLESMVESFTFKSSTYQTYLKHFLPRPDEKKRRYIERIETLPRIPTSSAEQRELIYLRRVYLGVALDTRLEDWDGFTIKERLDEMLTSLVNKIMFLLVVKFDTWYIHAPAREQIRECLLEFIWPDLPYLHCFFRKHFSSFIDMRLRHFRDSVARYFRDRPRRAPVQLPAEIKMAPLCNVSDDNNQKSDETQTVVQNGEACNETFATESPPWETEESAVKDCLTERDAGPSGSFEPSSSSLPGSTSLSPAPAPTQAAIPHTDAAL